MASRCLDWILFSKQNRKSGASSIGSVEERGYHYGARSGCRFQVGMAVGGEPDRKVDAFSQEDLIDDDEFEVN